MAINTTGMSKHSVLIKKPTVTMINGEESVMLQGVLGGYSINTRDKSQ